MSTLSPVAFDIESSGLDDNAVITVAGFRDQQGDWLILNTEGRSADGKAIVDAIQPSVDLLW